MEPGLEPVVPFLSPPEGGGEPCMAADARGRPVLVVHEEDFDPTFFDQVLEMAHRLPAAAARARHWFARATEPRLIVLASHYERGALERLEVLARALPLRAYFLAGEDGEARPELVPAAAERRTAAQAPQDLEPAMRGHLQRVIAACTAVVPPFQVEASALPWLVHGPRGVRASLHPDERPPLFCGVSGGAVARIELIDEVAADGAIDLLLRAAQDAVTDAG